MIDTDPDPSDPHVCVSHGDQVIWDNVHPGPYIVLKAHDAFIVADLTADQVERICAILDERDA